MKIKDAQVDGFGVWTGLTVDGLPDTMSVFYGPNEAGKTTLMQFLRTMFYGFTPERRQRYLPPVHGGRPGGAIRVTGPGGGYEIARRAQLDQGGVAGQLSVTGSDGLSQGQHRLSMLMGSIDETIFTNVFAIGLRELQELSTLDDTAAADELYKLSSGLDRVSLVDVTRQLRTARAQVVGITPEAGQVQQLMLKREKLRDEIDALTARGRRWAELAALRATQQGELEELKQRIEQWELESRTFEVALQVRPNWQQRAALVEQINALNARTDVPESAAAKLKSINEEIAQRQARLSELKQQRRGLRERSRNLPLRASLLKLTPKIEAAAEQAPWIGQIQKHIQRIESQLVQTTEQLREDAKRLGISEEDCEALLADRRMARMPDLSAQAIGQLSEPARDVRTYMSRMKQAKQQSEVDKKEAERLAKELAGALATREHDSLHEAMASTSDLIALLRKRLQIQEALDKQIHRRAQLEEEAVDLAADEALPVERSFMMGLVFVGGAFFALWGLAKVMPGGWFGVKLDPNSGLLFLMLGAFMLFFWFTWGNMLDRTTVGELDDCEDQLEALKKEIRKTESERDEYDRRLPAHTGSLEVRLRDAEAELATLETLLPLQHNHQAATERYKSARRRAMDAAESLRHARNQWEKTLQQLGITQSLSPKSIRIMAEGYDSLLQTRKRMQTFEDELDQRRLELGAIVQRVDGLLRQATATKKASEEVGRAARESATQPTSASNKESRPERDKRPAAPPVSAAAPQPAHRADADAGSIALEQINRLVAMISEQEQYIQQRRGLKEEDAVLAKQAAGLSKAIDRLHRAHSALLAEIGCESEEQLHELLDRKAQHAKLLGQHAEFNDRIRAVIGGAVAYDAIAKYLDNPGAEELEKRWDAVQQRIVQAEKRVDQLHGRQGEIGQEMKSIAADTRLSDAKLEMACLENQLKACAAHWQTLAATTHMLDKVCEVYETERQPETLREASAFLNQLTEGKYVRVWTPLGKNQLRIDNAAGQALPLEVLSRGTRETVFIALRLSLAAAYARRGVMLPLVLDDVFVNFDRARTLAAARVLRDFAALGHQVVMFTCHEHIMRIFFEIGVEVRVLPAQGQPGEARVYVPELPVINVPASKTAGSAKPVKIVEREPEAEPTVQPTAAAPLPAPPAIVAQTTEAESAPSAIARPSSEPTAAPAPAAPASPPMLPAAPITPEPPVSQPPVSQPPACRVAVAAVERKAPLADEPSIDWLWYEDDFDSQDPIDRMAARAPEIEKVDDPELSGWIESVGGPNAEGSYPAADDPWWQRPISA